MQRIDNGTAVAALPAIPAAGTPGYFSNGNPQTGQPSTVVDAWWMNMVQEEILAVIAGAEIAPSKTVWTQLRDAIQLMIDNAAPTFSAEAIFIEGASFAPGVADRDVVYYDAGESRYDKATAGANTPVGVADVTATRVYFRGRVDELFAGLTPGLRYYLSDSVAGGVTATPPATVVQVLIAQSASDVVIDLDFDAATAVLPNSTTAQRGIIETATNAECVAGSDSERAVTPAGLAAALAGLGGIVASSYTNPGYVKFGGGLIIQWGRQAGSGEPTTEQARTLPIAFPTAGLSVNATLKSGAGDFEEYIAARITNSQVFYSNQSFVDVYWIAVGH